MKTRLLFCLVVIGFALQFGTANAFAFNKPGSNNAYIKSITNSSGSIAAYTINNNFNTSVSPSTNSITVLATPFDPNATITINGAPVVNGTSSQSITLNNSGSTVINIVVTAQDGVSIQNYTLTVSKTGSNNAYLKSITNSTGSIAAYTTNNNFNTSVVSSTNSITVLATPLDPNATITINGAPVVNGTSSQSITLNNSGSTVINIVVTAQDGVSIQNYTLTVSKTGSNNAYLKSITNSTGSIAAYTTNNNFNTSVVSSTNSITVLATPLDPNATITINGAPVVNGTSSQSITLNNSGSTVINIVVTAQDGVSIQNYTLTVSKTGSNNAYLKSITNSTGSAFFYTTKNNFNTTVAGNPTSLTVTATTADANATLTVNGNTVASGTPSQNIMLNNVGTTTVNIIVTAQDGVTQQHYTLTINKAGSSTNFTWTGNTNSNWSVATNWLPNGNPGAGDNVTIPATSNPPTVDILSACASLTITGTTTIALSATLNVSNALTTTAPLSVSGTPGSLNCGSLVVGSGGTLVNSGKILINGGNVSVTQTTYINNLSGGSFSINGPSVIAMQLQSQIANAGNFTISGATVDLGNSATISNAANGTFTINGGSTIDFAANSAASAYISNAGLFYAGTSNSACTFNFNYAGANLKNTGNFYLGSTSSINLTGASSYVANTGNFTLQSDISGSATVGNISGGSAALFGTYKVERYISGGSAVYRSYRLLSSPVYTAAAGGNNIYSLNYVKLSSLITGTGGTAGGFDKAGNPSLYLYRDNIAPSNSSFTSGNFRGISNISTDPSYSIDSDGSGFNIPVGNGFLFFFRGDRTTNLANKYAAGTVAESVTMTTTGTLNQGQVVYKPWFNPSSSNLDYTTVTGNSSILGFALGGNPYASSIDWDTYNTTSPTSGIYAPNTSSFMYILDPVSKNYNVYSAGFGGFGTIATANSNIIPSGQGFFVQATSTGGQLVFNESAKTNTQVSTSDHNLFLTVRNIVTPTVTNQYLHLTLSKDTINTDGALINFNSNATAAYTLNEDAPYKPGNGAVSLSSVSSDKVTLAINTLPFPKQTQTVIPLNVNTAASGVYSLNMPAAKGIPALFDIWLMDAYKKDSLDIKHNPTYSFNVNLSDPTSFGSNRFTLVIRQNPALGVHLLSFNATKVNGGSQLTWTTENEQNYTNFTTQRSTDGGANFASLGSISSTGTGNYSFTDKAPLNGINQYRLKIQDLNGAVTYSNVVSLTYSSVTALAVGNISVYPNPSKGPLSLSINPANNSKKLISINDRNVYQIKIVSNTGAVIKTASTNNPTWQTDVSTLMPGTYVIQVLNKSDNSVVGKGTFIKL